MSQSAAVATTNTRDVNIQRRGALLQACSGSKMQKEEVWKEGGKGGGQRGGLTFPQAFLFLRRRLFVCLSSTPLLFLFRSPLALVHWNGPETGDRTPAVLGEHR